MHTYIHMLLSDFNWLWRGRSSTGHESLWQQLHVNTASSTMMHAEICPCTPQTYMAANGAVSAQSGLFGLSLGDRFSLLPPPPTHPAPHPSSGHRTHLPTSVWPFYGQAMICHAVWPILQSQVGEGQFIGLLLYLVNVCLYAFFFFFCILLFSVYDWVSESIILHFQDFPCSVCLFSKKWFSLVFSFFSIVFFRI